MCGIITVMSTEGAKLKTDRAKFFKEGIIVDSLRGMHSTGIFAAGKEANDTIWFKKPVPGYDFVHLPNYTRMHSNFEQVHYAIAHNRHATKGVVNVANSHPFHHGSITGVHNGSLWTYRHLALDESFDTDSEHIFHSIANVGVADTVKSLDGAFALVWHDASDHTMHYIRNTERPFHLAYIKGQDTVVGASEKLMLKMLCDRADLEIEKLHQLKVGREYIFNLQDLKNPTEIDRKLYVVSRGTHAQQNFLQQGHQQQSAQGGHTTSGNNYSTRSRTQSYRRAEVLLEQYGLKLGDTIDFWVGHWSKYDNSQNNKYGQVTGAWSKEPYLSILINGVEKEIYDKMDNWYYKGNIVACSMEAGNKLVLILDKNTMIEIPDEEDAPPKESGSTNPFDDDECPFGGEEDAMDVVDRILREEDNESWPKKYYKHGTPHSMHEALKLINNGCCMCGKKLKLSDFSLLDWVEDDPMCPKCSAKLV